MKITKLSAENVHGYLPIDVEFFDDLTFLTGLNGSGKTSALRLLMALLVPNIQELGTIAFTSATVMLTDGGNVIVVKANKSDDGVELAVSTVDVIMKIGRPELELFLDSKRTEELRSQIRDIYQSNPVFQEISRISTPMFLGLDRRFTSPSVLNEDSDDFRRREYMARRFWPEDPSFRGTSANQSLIEVNYLAVSRMQEIRAKQEQLDERLRGQFFTKAFEYKVSNFLGKNIETPSRKELDLYRQQLTRIEQAAEGLRIPVPEIQTALTHFFGRMSNVVSALEKNAGRAPKKGGKKALDKSKQEQSHFDSDYFEWIINRPQADRILEHLNLLNILKIEIH